MSDDYHITRIASELRAEKAKFEADKAAFEAWRAEQQQRHDALLASKVEISLGERVRGMERREATLAKREAKLAKLETSSAIAHLIKLRDRRLALRTWARRR